VVTRSVLVQCDSGPLLAPGERQQEALSLAHKSRRPAIGEYEDTIGAPVDTRFRSGARTPPRTWCLVVSGGREVSNAPIAVAVTAPAWCDR
jgi:hypothetical protein